VACLFSGAPLRAETEAAPGAQPAEPAESSVPMGEIAARSKQLAEDLKSLESSLASDTEQKSLEADLVRLAERVEPQAPKVTETLAHAPSLATLSHMRLEWQGLERQLAARDDRLRGYVDSLEKNIEELAASRALWRTTRERSLGREAPPAILAAVDAALKEIGRASAVADGTLNDALVLQSQFSELHYTVQETLTAIENTRQRVLANLLVRDEPPLWDEALAPQLAEWSDWRFGDFLKELRDGALLYGQQHPDRIALHALAFALLLWAVRSARGALRRASRETQGEENAPAATALVATDHAVSAALVLALLATPFFHEEMPRALRLALRIAFIVPLFVVLRPLLGEALRAPLYLLTGFAVVDRVREVLTGAPAPGRAVFAAEMLALAGVLAWLLQRRRLDRLPASARGNRWFAALGLWIRFAAVAAGVAALASLFGYMRFATLLGGGMLASGYAALVLYALVRITEGLASALFGGHVLASVRMVDHHRALFLNRTRALIRVAALLLWLDVVASRLALKDPIVRGLGTLLGTHFGYGGFEVTLGGIVAFVVTLGLAWLLSRAVRFMLEEEIFPRVSLPRGVPFALSTLARYAILWIGFLIALSALGFSLDRITILLGAFGVGVGFGLQTVVNNFVSGLILLFERPIKVGDMVEFGGLEGTVQRIGIRASTVRTWDGADVIVPNATLISDRVVNWTLSDRLRRLIVPVGVAYGTDPHRVIDVLRGVAESYPGVCAYPKPVIVFSGFGESALNFELRVWTDNPETLLALRSGISLAVHDALRDAGIEIPFPQRDLRLRSVDPEAAAALQSQKTTRT
jgi:small-conductance mechanosensitive channel